MNQGDLHKVWEIKALKRKPRADEAQKILERISKHVQPIMRKRKWRVKVLSEFCSKNLLGLNVGAGIHVKLRLRASSNELNFIPFEQVLDTMLHELCHNVHGPHNANFYSLWDELRKECEELTNKGIIGTGEGFDLPGRRLGGFSRQPPLSSLRQTAVAAAEKRTRLNSLLPSGPKRLGGDSSVMSALSPIQAAAMAAERRYQDNMWCASEFPEMVNIEEEEEDYVEPPVLKPARETQTTTTSCHAESSKTGHKRSDVSSSQSCKKRHVEFVDLSYETPVSMWECGTCTLLNPPLAPVCKICGSEKAKDLKEWSCKFCTMENSVKIDKCSACEQWRYSHGHPVATSVLAGHWS